MSILVSGSILFFYEFFECSQRDTKLGTCLNEILKKYEAESTILVKLETCQTEKTTKENFELKYLDSKCNEKILTLEKDNETCHIEIKNLKVNFTTCEEDRAPCKTNMQKCENDRKKCEEEKVGWSFY